MKPPFRSYLTRCALSIALVALPTAAFAGEADCGPLKNHYGPFDYRTTSPEQRTLVEGAHFTQKVESLSGGNTSITAGGDMNYTLKVYPNHHRALMAVIKLSEKEKRDKPHDMIYTVACWFDRAERFRPDDGTVKMLHGIYLIRKGKAEAAADKLEQASALAGENANITYNLGLAYFDLKQYDKSLASAHAAYALGFPLPGLRDKLKRAGKWSEPMPVAVNQPKMPEITSQGEASSGTPASTPIMKNGEPAGAASSPAN